MVAKKTSVKAEVKKAVAVKSTEAKVKSVKVEGTKTHPMNINMKNKIFGSLNWVKDTKFESQKDHVMVLKDNKHYPRILTELKIYDVVSKELLKNVGEVLKCRSKYWIAKDGNNMFLVESDEHRVPIKYVQIKNA